jgi:hypothetical protein
MTARLYEWTLNRDAGLVDLYDVTGLDAALNPELVGVDHLARFWPLSAWLCVAGSPAVMHQHHAEGEALAAAARAGLIDPGRITGSYRINKRLVTFYVGDVCVIGRHFATVAGEAGRRVTEAARLYPSSPLAAAWLIARDEILDRGLAREAA